MNIVLVSFIVLAPIMNTVNSIKAVEVNALF